MITERFAIGDGPVRTLYPGTPLGDRLAAERNAVLGSTCVDEQPVARSASSHIGHVPRPAARKPREGRCFKLLDTGGRCGAPFTFAGAPNRLYCDEHSSGVQRRGRG